MWSYLAAHILATNVAKDAALTALTLPSSGRCRCFDQCQYDVDDAGGHELRWGSSFSTKSVTEIDLVSHGGWLQTAWGGLAGGRDYASGQCKLSRTLRYATMVHCLYPLAAARQCMARELQHFDQREGGKVLWIV